MMRRRIARFAAFCVCIALLAGCTWLNAVVPLEKGGLPSAGRAVVIYGVRVDAPLEGSQFFSVALDAFNVDKQALVVDCWRHYQTAAAVPGVPGPTRYFAFEVRPGHYLHGAWTGHRLRGGPLAFHAPKDQVVFVGEFVYTGARDLELQRDLERARPEILRALPGTPQRLSLANSVPATRIEGFLCSP
jgi:hypothetical protein